MYYTGLTELTQSCGAQLTNKIHFYCEKLNSSKFCGGMCPQCPLVPPPMVLHIYVLR